MSDFRLHLSNQLLEYSRVIGKVVGHGNHAAGYIYPVRPQIAVSKPGADGCATDQNRRVTS